MFSNLTNRMRCKFQLMAIALAMVRILYPISAPAITINEEERLGQQFITAAARQLQLINNPIITDYINRIGQEIVAQMPPQPFVYHFYVIKNDIYNAFAGPAAHIFIHSGLIAGLDNENELAAIIGHECAHVACRHISDRIERQGKIQIGTLAGMAAGILLGAAGGGAAASALTLGSAAAGQSAMLSYSRADEMQADQIGLRYLTRCGYDGAGLLTSLNKIRAKQWFGSDQIPTYLTTHPAAEDRIIYIDGWLKAHAQTMQPVESKDPQAFKRVQTEIKARYGNPEVMLIDYQQQIAQTPKDPLANYGYGLLLARTGDYRRAETHLKTALGRRAFDPGILSTLGMVYFLEGKYDEAGSILTHAAAMAGDDPDTLFYLGRVQLEREQIDAAVQSLTQLTENNPHYVDGFYFLSKAYSAQGQMTPSHTNLAMYYRKQGDFKNALFQFQRALKSTDDPAEQKRIQEQIDEIEKAGAAKGRSSGRNRR